VNASNNAKSIEVFPVPLALRAVSCGISVLDWQLCDGLRIFVQVAAFDKMGSLPTSAAAQQSRDMVPRQRRVVVVGGHGGSEDQ